MAKATQGVDVINGVDKPVITVAFSLAGLKTL